MSGSATTDEGIHKQGQARQGIDHARSYSSGLVVPVESRHGKVQTRGSSRMRKCTSTPANVIFGPRHVFSLPVAVACISEHQNILSRSLFNGCLDNPSRPIA
jgi:hypothetical protein